MNGRETIITTVHQVLNSIFEHHMRAEHRVLENIENWNNAFKEQDFKEMENIYARIQEDLSMLMPLSGSLNELGRLQNLHNLIKNNGNNFDISEHEKNVAGMLIAPSPTSVLPKILESLM